MSVGWQIVWLLVLALPVASVTWTVTREEVFREPRTYCKRRSESESRLWRRKFFYLFTCEYCFSHYVSAGFLLLTGYRLLLADWRGFVIAFFALPWIANVYIGIYGQLKLGVKKDRAEIETLQHEAALKQMESASRKGENRPTLHRPVA